MSDMKCPFCQQKLEGFYVENRPVFACCNLNCKGYFMNAPEELWQELIRTRKALDVAVDALKRIADAPIGYCLFAEEALEQITALEQKDVGRRFEKLISKR